MAFLGEGWHAKGHRDCRSVVIAQAVGEHRAKAAEPFPVVDLREG